MNARAGSGASRTDLSAGVGVDQDVLVLTNSQHRGRNGLALPFRNAVVVDMGGAEALADLAGPFDTTVISGSAFDLSELDATVQAVFPALRPSGRIVIVFDHQGTLHGHPATEAPTLPGVRWSGLANLNGMPCAILTPDSDPTPERDADVITAGKLVATLAEALRIAEESHATTRAALDRARAALADQLDDRHKSERALLDHLAGRIGELEALRVQLTGVNAVRTVLTRSRPGRAALRALRPAWRMAKGVRRRIRTLRRGESPA